MTTATATIPATEFPLHFRHGYQIVDRVIDVRPTSANVLRPITGEVPEDGQETDPGHYLVGDSEWYSSLWLYLTEDGDRVEILRPAGWEHVHISIYTPFGDTTYATFQESPEKAWILRELVQGLPSPITFNDEEWNRLEVTRSSHVYVSKLDPSLVRMYPYDGLDLVFRHSGDDGYPLGDLLWGQKYAPESYAYQGGGISCAAEAVLLWEYGTLPGNI